MLLTAFVRLLKYCQEYTEVTASCVELLYCLLAASYSFLPQPVLCKTSVFLEHRVMAEAVEVLEITKKK